MPNLANPFRFNLPTSPQDFLGRTADIAQMADDLSAIGGDSYGIVGGRRFGKSSFLIALHHELLRRLDMRQAGEFLVLPVGLSLQAAMPDSPESLFGFLLHELRIATRGDKKRTPAWKKGRVIELSLHPYSATNASDATLGDLESDIDAVVRAASEAGLGLLRVALLIDEIDAVLDYPWTDEVFSKLRSLIYDGPVSDVTRLVLAGSGRYLSLSPKDSPLMNAVKPYFLRAFDALSMQALAARAPEIPAELLNEITRQTGGHIFIAQHILHYLFAKGLAQVTAADVANEVNRFRYDRLSDLEKWWYGVGEDGRSAYIVLAETMNWMTHAEVTQAVNFPDFQADRGLNALCFHGLAVDDGTYQRFRASGQLFCDWSAGRRAQWKAKARTSLAAPTQSQIGQQAGDDAVQLGVVNNSTIIVQRGVAVAAALDLNPARATRLRPIVEALNDWFGREDFQVLCFNIGIKYDNLRPDGLKLQVIELVTAVDEQQQIGVLLEEIKRQRPQLFAAKLVGLLP
jgi:hypothetical protein